MSQGVNITETEIVFFTEFFESEIQCVVVVARAIMLKWTYAERIMVAPIDYVHMANLSL